MGATNVQIETQVGSVSAVAGRLVSVVMSDERWLPERQVQPSTRTARYDGVIRYEPDWVIVIENKPWSASINPVQADPNVGTFEGTVDPLGIGLVWRELVSAMSSLVERQLISGAERLMTEDFLEFVDEHFGYLNPYSTLQVCKDNPYLLQKRCKAIMESIAPGRVYHKRGYEDYFELPTGAARQVYLFPQVVEEGEWSLSLTIWPADTVTQARDFFHGLDETAFFGLQRNGWQLKPNLHFAFIQRHIHWAETRLEIGEYIRYWRELQNTIRQYRREEFGALFDGLRRDGLISDHDLGVLRQQFIDTNKPSINVCPGVQVHHEWDRSEAMRLDGPAQLRRDVLRLVEAALAAWHQRLPPAQAATPA
jgi:hypothetical protein